MRATACLCLIATLCLNLQSDHAQLPIGEIIERVEIWHAKANRRENCPLLPLSVRH
jgi:hypothetical protein